MKKLISLTLAALLIAAVAVTPLLGIVSDAVRAEEHKAPDGYSQEEYDRMVEFFSYTDASGVTNGEKLSPNYDPDDISTWGDYLSVFWQPFVQDGLWHVFGIDFTDCGMTGVLDLSDFVNVRTVDVPGNSFNQIYLDGCTLLERVTANGNPIGSIDVSSCELLEDIDVTDCGLDELDISNNDHLIYFYASNNNIKELDFSEKKELWWAYCDNNELTELDLTDSEVLGTVYCQNNNISTLKLPSKTNARFGFSILDCSNNQLTDIDLSSSMYASMQLFFCAGNQLSELDLSSLEALFEIDFSNNHISDIDVSGLEYLEKLYCSNNNLTSLDVTSNPHLMKLMFDGNDIDSIDLSAQNNLFILKTSDLPEVSVKSAGSDSDNDVLNLYPCDIKLGTEGAGSVVLELSAEEDEDAGIWPLPYKNSTAAITAKADNGSRFTGWYNADGSLYSSDEYIFFDENTASLTLDLTATFEPALETPTATPEPPESETPTPSDPGTEPPVTETPTATPEPPESETPKPSDPGTEPPVTETPEPPVTNEPSEPGTEPPTTDEPSNTDAPGEGEPSVPPTGSVSLICLGISAVLSGVGAALFKRKHD